MARIRSVHPTLFTDEAFMAASAHARILMIGLWCEADDQGIFEWKPLTLKARLLPVDNVDVVALLEELSDCNVIAPFDEGGKRYGAIRNFRKFQRPQKPTAQHPLPDHMVSYVGISDSTTVVLPEQSRSTTVNPPQMEDGGGRKEKKEDAGASSLVHADPRAEFEEWYRRYPHKVSRGHAERAFVKARKLASLQDLVEGLERYIAAKPPNIEWRNPATWLNGKGWLDSPAATAQSRSPPKRTGNAFAALALKLDGLDHDDEQPHHDGPTLDIVPNARYG